MVTVVVVVADMLPISMLAVTYKYEEDPLQKNFKFSATFNQGQMIAVVGDRGSGKSTFLQLLAGDHIYWCSASELLHMHL